MNASSMKSENEKYCGRFVLLSTLVLLFYANFKNMEKQKQKHNNNNQFQHIQSL